MGLIKAAAGAGGGVLADQWKEYFYCDALPAEVLAVKGQKRTNGRSANRHGSENVISDGSVIAVADGQCVLIVEQGKVVDLCAEAGEYTYNTGTIFAGAEDEAAALLEEDKDPGLGVRGLQAQVDVVILVSDNESWVDGVRRGATETMLQWERIKQRNPDARLVCIDMQPYGTTQAMERDDILNVGGFSDAVFDVVASFAEGRLGAEHWVGEIEKIALQPQ